MIAWVIWEDQRSGTSRRFGPHELMITCLADDCGRPRQDLAEMVRASPKGGKEKVLAALKGNFKKLRDDGPVCAVLDRDQAHRLWGSAYEGPKCLGGLTNKIKDDAPGDYEIVLLEKNIETLVAACFAALGQVPIDRKHPEVRDRICQKLAYGAYLEARGKVRHEVPSFDRLVKKVGQLIPAP